MDAGATTGLCLLEVRGARAWWVGDDSSRDPLGSTLILDEGPAIVAIEDIRTVYPRERFGHWMATAIAATSKLTGRIQQYFEERGTRVVLVAAATWRRDIVGKGNASNRMIQTVIEAGITDWPKRSSAHVRDAAGCALWGARHVQIQEAAAAAGARA